MLLTLPLTPDRRAETLPNQQPSCLLAVDKVTRTFIHHNGDSPTEALSDVSLRVNEGEFICIVGPSGCGKSTLLRILGGLLEASSGRVCLKDEPLTGPRREIGYVFQHANLMPWRTVLNNVALPLEIQHMPATEARARAQKVLALVGLDGFENAYPRQLSGGMAQRAALARTLVHAPEILLLDEPFGALDAITRERMNVELLRIRQAYHYTAVMVTHSIPEAVFLADRVLVMSQRPGTIIAEVSIPLLRPREIDILGTSEFASVAQSLRRAIDQTVGVML